MPDTIVYMHLSRVDTRRCILNVVLLDFVLLFSPRNLPVLVLLQVCTHWLRGHCSFGDKCRYDHVRPTWAPKADHGSEWYEPPSVSKPETNSLEDVVPISQLYVSKHKGRYRNNDIQEECGLQIDLPADPFGSDDGLETAVLHVDGRVEQPSSSIGDGLDASGNQIEIAWESFDDTGGVDCYGQYGGSLCYEYHNTGMCSNASCKLLHGNFCEICESYALNPVDESEAQQHIVECSARHERLKARARSVHVECCICLERVLEKVGGDRKFGLLSCDHAFCLTCIRNWRNNIGGGADIDSALRTCPVCRVTTHYITPSLTWPETQEEKEAIIAGYKAKLASIDCKNFNYGNGTCPFGISCMYKHAFPDGSLEDTAPRRVAADEGEVKYVQPVKLSDFLEIKQGRLRGTRR